MTTQSICKLDDIIPEAGVCALIDGKQVAIFRTRFDEVCAIDNFDPFSNANVLSRGLLGSTIVKVEDRDGNLNSNEVIYVSSPIYKQRFDLTTGQCLDDDDVKLNTYRLKLKDGYIMVDLADGIAA